MVRKHKYFFTVPTNMQISKPVPAWSSAPSCSFRSRFKFELKMHCQHTGVVETFDSLLHSPSHSLRLFNYIIKIRWCDKLTKKGRKGKVRFGKWLTAAAAPLCSAKATWWQDILNNEEKLGREHDQFESVWQCFASLIKRLIMTTMVIGRRILI